MNLLSREERRRLWLRMGLRAALLLAGLAGLRLLGPVIWSLFSPFLLAIPAAWVLSPAVRWLHRRLRVSQKLLTVLLLLVVFALLGGLLWGVFSAAVRELSSLLGNWNSLLTSFQGAADRMGEALSRMTGLLPRDAQDTGRSLSQQLYTWLKNVIPGMLSGTVDWATGLVKNLPSFVVAAVVFIMAAYFLTSDYSRLRASLAGRLPQGPRVLLGLVKRAAAVGMGGYLRAQLILSTGVFSILLLSFLMIGQDYALLLALALAVLDFIPILGAGTVLVPWIAVDLFAGSYRHAVGLAVVWGLVSLFRRVGEPKILGDQTGLPPVVSLVSIYAGMKVAGVLGMILGPILCLVCRDLALSGLLDPSLADLRLAVRDMRAILSQSGEKP